jgi:carbohydrate kinase (thermoresistant glucokinase family)
MGVSGCGKSSIGQSLAERLGLVHLEGDAYHSTVSVNKMAAGIPLTDEDRADWLERLKSEIAGRREKGEGVVLSCSALKRRYRDLLRGGDPDLLFFHLAGSRDLIAERMSKRANHYMPLSLLDSQFRDLEPLASDEAGLVLDIGADPERIVDTILQALQP